MEQGTDGDLVALLRAQVRRRPDEVAVSDGEEHVTFGQFAGRIAALGEVLRGTGVRGDDCVGLFVEPTIDLAVGAWAILHAGGAYLPLAPEYPDARLRHMLEDSRARVVLTQEHLRARLADLAPPGLAVVTPDGARHHGTGGLPLAGDHGPHPGSLAYVIYTSGSTGRPKGVMVEHRSIVNQMRWLQASHGIDERRVVLQKTPISFDAAQWEVLAPACGSRLVLGGPGIHRDLDRLVDTVATSGVTTLQCVPTLLKALLETERFAGCHGLVQVFSGGEPLTWKVAQDCLETLPGCQLVNLYGPTECTINASSFTVDPERLPAGQGATLTVPIGTPAHGTRLYVLDAGGSLLDDGQVGELHVAGVQVARGYLHRPDLTAERFVDNPFRVDDGFPTLYRTGDLAYRDAEGNLQFVGRADNQVKLRGFRIELDEVRMAIESHDWVKDAAVLVKEDRASGDQRLLAFIELSPKEAALMDQGLASAHHQSKESRLQIRAQLSNGGCRDQGELEGRPVVELPGRTPTEDQRRRVFARKTYRFFDGPPMTRDDVLRVLERHAAGAPARAPGDLTLEDLGTLLRWFGQYHSPERLLPKYAYASPGALYATQLYLELDGVAGLPGGLYYYHPVEHHLVLLSRCPSLPKPRAHVHLVGKRRAVEPVYRRNVGEVLEIEAGHMIGLLECVLPGYGLDVRPHRFVPGVRSRLGCAPDDLYLGTFRIVPHDGSVRRPSVDVYVQAHPGRVEGLPAGQYRHVAGDLERVADDLVLRKHVVAINQEVYERASVGITFVSRARRDWLSFVELGRALHLLQTNDLGLGFMSSGYSSRSGDDLPSARRIEAVLRDAGLPTGHSYFCVGGRVSEEQVRSMGMKEDAVHMRGPTEMIRDDLVDRLPDYMVPSKVVVLDRLPRTASGKLDPRALEAVETGGPGNDGRPFVAPRTPTERRVGDIWAEVLGPGHCSVTYDFFETGGNSLVAVTLVNRLNRELGCSLPQQVLFECPTIEDLAGRLDREATAAASRLVPLRPERSGQPLYVWPGLGGHTMSLRSLAARLRLDRPVLGVQACGLNDGEVPYADLGQIAREDIELIRRHQPAGPYLLCGYSFGARIAFEVACRLEAAGEQVEHLLLVAPGMPHVGRDVDPRDRWRADYDNEVFVAVLLSVFTGDIDPVLVEECAGVATNDVTFAAFVRERFPHLDQGLVERIVALVRATYASGHAEVGVSATDRLAAPVTVFRAKGDEPSFADTLAPAVRRTFVDLDADHYAVLRETYVGALVEAIQDRMDIEHRRHAMPHVNIKHFPAPLDEARIAALSATVSRAVADAFGCDEGVVSIALEPVEQKSWNETVYEPEIVNRKHLLCKVPSY